MQEGRFSRTALGAAGHRAAHQVLEGGRVFADPLALRILGPDAEAAIALAREQPLRRGMRLFVAVRSRFAEDAARRAIAHGVRQVVALGAGLDTFAYRVAPADGLIVYEVDHPATQAEKRRRLAAASIAPTARVVYAACDFERERFVDALAAAGFDGKAPAFFSWLGVTPYLSQEAVFAAFAAIAALPGGAEVAFDYANPTETIARLGARAAREKLAEKVAATGEPLRAFFEPGALRAQLAELGLSVVEDLGPAEIAERFFPGHSARRGGGGHVALVAAGR